MTRTGRPGALGAIRRTRAGSPLRSRGSMRAAAVGALLLPGAVFLWSARAAAQTQAELRSGLTVGSHSGSAAALDISPALSFDVSVRRQMWPRVALFAGYYRTAFGCEDGYCKDQEITVVGNHAAVGAEWGSGGPWLRLGVLVGATSAGTGGDAPSLGLGVLGAAGLTVGQGRMRFMPGVSYRWMTANSATDSDRAIALALDVGVGVRVGGS